MSDSPDTQARARVTAAVGAATEVFLVNHAFELVARSVGSLDVQVPPGVYKIKFRRGNAVSQETLVLPPDTPAVDVTAPAGFGPETAQRQPPPRAPQRAARAVPGAGAAPSRATARATRRSSALAVTVTARSEAPVAPFAGVRLCDEKGRTVADQAAQRADKAEMVLPSLRPGVYRLQVTLKEVGTLEQTLALCRGWRTEVETGVRNYALPGEPAVWGADLGDATILMAPEAEPAVPDEVRNYAKLVKAWLAGPQLTIATAHAERVVSTSIADPLFGLCLAHALVRQTEIDRSSGTREPRPRRALVKALVDTLQTLVPGHPDLEALRLWLGRRVARRFALPPMLANSWTIVAAAASRRPTLVPADSVASLVAERVWSSPTWLLWRSDDVSAPEASVRRVPRRTLIERLTRTPRIARSVPAAADRTANFSDLERAVCQAVGQVVKTTEAPAAIAAKAMKRIGVPAATFDRALQSAVQKLED